jgi:transglutaminase-like putative cysteine protease
LKKTAYFLIGMLIISLFSACGVTPPEESSSSPVSVAEPDPSSEAEPASDSSNPDAFDILTERQQEIYDQIVAAAQDLVMDEIELPQGSTMEDIDRGFNGAMADNPQIFWLAKEYSVRTVNNVTGIQLQYLVETKEELAQQQQQLAAAAGEAQALLAGVTDPFEQELALHDWLIRRVSYSDEAATDTSGQSAAAYTAYGALVEGQAVCEGYARGMQLLLREAGIKCTLLSGLGNGTDHMWNVVTINGRDYHLDPTWNDVIHPDNGQDVSHVYFNITDEQISIDHSDFEAPGCVAVEDNFFVKTGRVMDSYGSDGRDRIAAYLKELHDRGETILEIRFTSRDAYLAAGSDLFENYGIFTALQKANQLCGTAVFREDRCSNGDLTSEQNVLTILPEVQ